MDLGFTRAGVGHGAAAVGAGAGIAAAPAVGGLGSPVVRIAGIA